MNQTKSLEFLSVKIINPTDDSLASFIEQPQKVSATFPDGSESHNIDFQDVISFLYNPAVDYIEYEAHGNTIGVWTAPGQNLIEYTELGHFYTDNETGKRLIRVNYALPMADGEILARLANDKGVEPTRLGVEGCPGQWYTARVEVIHNTRHYAIVEITGSLDV